MFCLHQTIESPNLAVHRLSKSFFRDGSISGFQNRYDIAIIFTVSENIGDIDNIGNIFYFRSIILYVPKIRQSEKRISPGMYTRQQKSWSTTRWIMDGPWSGRHRRVDLIGENPAVAVGRIASRPTGDNSVDEADD